MVPHLRTALTGAISELEHQFISATPAIERWFRMEWQEHTPPFYTSVNIRNAGFKLSPVDTNLFPDGFNHLAEEMYPLATQAVMAAIEKYCPDAKNLLIIPENNTSDHLYLQNVAQLSKILRLTGLNVRLGSLSEEIIKPTKAALGNGEYLMLEPLERNGRRITLDKGSFDPCTILLNNNLSSGIPTILENIKEQVLLPQLHAGQTTRRKSMHLTAYNDVAKKFAKFLNIDPWLINPFHAKVAHVDFGTIAGKDALAHIVEQQLKKITKKYKEYGVTNKPFVIFSADASSHDIGVTKVYNPSEIKNLNYTQHKSASPRKDGLQITDLLIQEGVPSIERWQEYVAEPVVYMIDRYVVGGFYRVHKRHDTCGNLNSFEQNFTPLPFVKHSERTPEDLNTTYNRFYPYGVVARLAMLAASIELERTDPNPEVE